MQYDDPKIIWHPRKNSSVTIIGGIPLWNYKRQDCDWIPIKLRIPRKISTLLSKGEKLSEKLEVPINILFIPGTLGHLAVDIAGTLKEVAMLIQKKESYRAKVAALKESYKVRPSTPDDTEESYRMRLATHEDTEESYRVRLANLEALKDTIGSSCTKEQEIMRDRFSIEWSERALGYEIPRKQVLSLPLMAYNTVRIVLKRSDLTRLKNFFNNPPRPESPSHFTTLFCAIKILLLSDLALRFLDQPPRGKAAEVYPLTSSLPAALFACQELVRRAKRDKGLRDEIYKIFKEEVKLINYWDKQAEEDGGTEDQITAVCLVHRAFSGLWEAIGHPGLLTKKPRDVFREYLYRGKRGQKIASALKEASQRDPALYNDIISSRIRTYLGPPGAAAKAFFPY